jgi:hypothetical protein
MRRFIFILISGAAFLADSPSYAQVTQDWAKIYNGPGNGIDIAFSVAVDGQGNVYITGNSPEQRRQMILPINTTELGDGSGCGDITGPETVMMAQMERTPSRLTLRETYVTG